MFLIYIHFLGDFEMQELTHMRSRTQSSRVHSNNSYIFEFTVSEKAAVLISHQFKMYIFVNILRFVQIAH